MAVTLEDAIQTLQTMFPTLDAETLEEVLKQQGGHMENTVEILLGFASEATAEDAIRSADAPPLSASVHAASPQAGARSPAAQQQLSEDEVLAMALQNQLFLEDMRADPEFAAAVRAGGFGGPRTSGRSHSGSGSAARPPSPPLIDTDKALASVKAMGQSAKESMLAMWNKFTSKAKEATPTVRSSAQYTALADDDEDSVGLHEPLHAQQRGQYSSDQRHPQSHSSQQQEIINFDIDDDEPHPPHGGARRGK
jgi:hypothetical protein